MLNKVILTYKGNSRIILGSVFEKTIKLKNFDENKL